MQFRLIVAVVVFSQQPPVAESANRLERFALVDRGQSLLDGQAGFDMAQVIAALRCFDVVHAAPTICLTTRPAIAAIEPATLHMRISALTWRCSADNLSRAVSEIVTTTSSFS